MDKLQVDVAENRVALKGDISYKTVMGALNSSAFSKAVSSGDAVSVDFAGVAHADSSGLALMIHWLRQAKSQNVTVEFNNIPKKLVALAEMSNLEKVLPFS